MLSSSFRGMGRNGQWLNLRCRGLIFIFLERERTPSLYIFGHSDRWFSTEQEVKLFYAARAMRGHQFGGVPTTPRGRDLFLLALIFG